MSLKELLAERKIACVHIVDDAFDTVPSHPYSAEDAQHLLDVVDDDDLKAICAAIGIDENDENGFRAAIQELENVQKLFDIRSNIKGAAAQVLYAPFDKDQEGKMAQVKPLLDLLEQCGVRCQCFGANYDPKGSEEPQILFVDLKLKEGRHEVPRHEDAVRIHQILLEAHRECKPFVFLMSSLASILPGKRENFRQDAELFQSEFEDIDKAVFKNGDELTRILASYTKSLPQLSLLRDRMEQVEAAVDEAVQKVMRELRALDLADYFVLYHNTTAVEKVQLGSYIVEMLLEYLAHEVEGQERIWNLAKALDALNVQELPRARFGITPAAARLYSANMLHSNAMLLAEDGMQHGPSQGYFFTGDIYLEAQALHQATPSRAYAIITPACDLVRPDKLKGRSVLLVEGSVKEMEHGATLTAAEGLPLAVLPHPRVKDRHVLIEWHRKKLLIWDDEDRAKFADPEKCSFVRVGRLRPVYALQLQHAVTTDLSRVGTQKPPSALIPHGLKCFVSDGTKWHEVYEDKNADAAALSDSEQSGKKYTLFVLSDPAMHKSLVEVAAWVEKNPEVKGKASFLKVLEDESRQVLRGIKQRVPEKAAQGKQLDITSYPFSDVWVAPDKKFVAVVRGTKCASPYAQIAQGQAVNQAQEARIVFRLEPSITQDDEVGEGEDPAVEGNA